MKSAFLLAALLLGSAGAQSPVPPALPITATIPISRFGAKGDGVTDDSKAFLVAIAAASKLGAELTLENKTYLLKQTLRISHTAKPMAIVGGGHSTLLFAPDHPLQNGFLIDGSSGVKLGSFTLSGSAAGLHCGINLDGSSNIRLENLVIERVRGAGLLDPSAILLSNDDQVWITDSTISNIGPGPGKRAEAIWNYYRARTQHLYIKHNHIFNNSAAIVIGLFDTDHAVVEDNIIDGDNTCVKPCINNGYGILFYMSIYPKVPLVDETIMNNQVMNTAGSGIYLQGVHGAKVVGNTITDSGLQMNPVSLPVAGIALNYANDIQVLANTITRSRQAGIALATTQNVLIKGNQIHDSGRYGIHLRVAQVSTTIQNNVLDGAPVGLFSQGVPIKTITEKNVLTRVKRPTVGQMR